MNLEENTPIPDRNALWAAARQSLAFFLELFGGAAAIASARLISVARRKAMLEWLRPIEDLLRRLIALDALALSAPVGEGARGRLSRRARQGRGRAGADDFAWDNPATWRVGFRLAPAGGADISARLRGVGPVSGSGRVRWSHGVCGSLAVAARLEAAMRVAAHPHAFVRRAARRMWREPGIIERLARAPTLSARTPCGAAILSACAALRGPAFMDSG